MSDLPSKPAWTPTAKYRATHSRDGYPLGGTEYPDNREGRRRMARTWRKRNDEEGK